MVIPSHAHSKTCARLTHTPPTPPGEFIDRIKQSMQRAEGLLVALTGPGPGLAPRVSAKRFRYNW
jgi:hypothetical protein